MAIKIEQYQKTADGSYQLMYPKTQADCVSVSSGGNLQTKLSDIDKKVTYELTCSKTGSTHALSGFPSVTGLVSCVFKADKDYAANDGFTVNSTSYSVQTLDGKALTAGAFKAGAVVPIIIDTVGKKINFKMGGSRQAGTRLVTEIFVGDPAGNQSEQTWHRPEGVTQARVRLFGAGGNGGNSYAPCGGGGGHMCFKVLDVSSKDTYTITFESRTANSGGPTKFEQLMTASGGSSGNHMSSFIINSDFTRYAMGCGGSGGGAGPGSAGDGNDRYYNGGIASYGGGGGGARGGPRSSYGGDGGYGGKYGGGGGTAKTSGSPSQYNQYIDGISFVGKTINGSVNTETEDPVDGDTTFRKGLGGESGSYNGTRLPPEDGVNTENNDYGIGPLDFKGQGKAGKNTSTIIVSSGFGGAGGFGGNGGNGGSGGVGNSDYECGGGGGGGGFGGNGGNGNEYAGGGGGGYGADGGNASPLCGGGGGGYGPFGKGGDGVMLVEGSTTYLNNADGGFAAGGGASDCGPVGKGGPGICIIQYYL